MNRVAPRLSRTWLRVAAVLGACYLSSLVVLNVAGTAQGDILNRLFPHIGPPIGPGGSLNLRSMSTAWSTVQRDYVIRGISGDSGTEGAERGLVEMLKANSALHDRYSAFLTRDQAAALNADLGGERNGSIGIALEGRCEGARKCPRDATPTMIVIENVLHGQPAEQAGLRNGDILRAVNGTRVRTPLDQSQSLQAQVGQIRGAANTTVSLTVERGGQPLTVTVRRADLRIPSVYTQTFGSTLYMQVTGFNSDTAAASRSQLQAGLGAGATSIVLDLRHNGGGFVSAAQSLASEFLARRPGQDDVVVRRGRMEAADRPQTAQDVMHDTIQPGGVALTPKLVVLVDSDSASASEIVAAALKDYSRATVVGERTVGKGSVQRDFPLPDGTDLHLTVEKWYGPRGESIDEKGVEPHHVVTLPGPESRFQLDAQSADPSQDAQLQAALAAARS
ncbi:MAG: S41 family peptidase [Candidatus Dormibacteria bacterium]